jgi:hypothetical protein
VIGMCCGSLFFESLFSLLSAAVVHYFNFIQSLFFSVLDSLWTIDYLKAKVLSLKYDLCVV